ncbi:MAG: monofunctional biosynthetic peptidoglycan transglycosylase [Desulfobacteraceae bacterium]
MGRAGKRTWIARLRRRLLKLLFLAILILLALTMLEVLLIRFVNPPITTHMAWRRAKSVVSSKPPERMRQEWRKLEAISPYLRQAVMAAEDQRFLSHGGFDFVELEDAVKDALQDGRVRGASTITMQAARTVFLWPDRTWLRKALEAYYTLLMELFWDKRRILEVYLNTVDWGPGLMGAEAACRAYFGIGAEEVTRSQAALLAAILPNPHRWSPVNPGPRVRIRQGRILRDMPKMPEV